MALAKQTGGRETRPRVQWPQFPAIVKGLEPEGQAALVTWYAQVRDSVDRAVGQINANVEAKNATS